MTDLTEPTSPAPTVSVLIVAWQSGDHLARCLEALERQSRCDFEAIIVDNASSDGAVDRLVPRPWLRIDRADRNLGFAVANNRAAAQARGRYLVTLNPDAFAEPGWLAALVAAAERHPQAGSVGSVQLLDADPTAFDGVGDPLNAVGAAWRGGRLRPAHPISESAVFGVCAAAALYRREAFEAAGGFCERFFCFYEDVDLGMRLRLAGWTAVVTPGAVVRHVGSASAPSAFVLRYATRNRVWAFLRGMPGPVLAAGAVPAALILAAGALADTLTGRGTARWSALREALAGLPQTLAERQMIQDKRRVTTCEFARALTWSPFAYFRRGIDLRPLPDLPARVAAPPESAPRIVAVVVSYQPDEALDRVLDAALAQADRVVLVENGSAPDIQERLAKRAAGSGGRLTLIANPTNVGLATAQNQGLAAATADGADWILLQDDDSVPGDGMVATMIDTWQGLADRGRVGLLTPRLTDPEGTLRPRLLTARGRFDLARTPLQPGTIARNGLFAIASGSLIRAPVLEVVGRMDDRFFIDYIDVEFSLRLRRAGFEIVGVGDATLHHRLGEVKTARLLGRTKTMSTHEAWRRRTIHRNRVRVWRRHGTVSFGWLAFDVLAALYDVWKAIAYEDDKIAKLKAIGSGFLEGWRD
ncbi:glycosyltransferase [Thalassobaculum sp.]|uniref:glycosyltransferase n=1 Tax=Thalassobaculum sp. TaxID=2022740 RepID=UPI0032ED1362